MKRTKTIIYAERGIKHKSGKIYCDGLDMWINPLMPIGTNSKVGNAATFSMKHGNGVLNIFEMSEKIQKAMEAAGITEIRESCPMHCKGCYCDYGFFNMPSVRDGNIIKLIIARLFPDWLERALDAQIEADHITQVRIHASGDFCTMDYINVWRNVALKNPDVTFWTYTKDVRALNAFRDIPNLHITPSCTPYGFNFGTCRQIIDMREKLIRDGYRVHVCACGTNMEKHCSDCNHGCKAIGDECDFVLFIMHSTPDYKAGVTDPDDYKELCDIIAQQNN